jgi:thiol-disulfide isomerase/thioredoxin
VSRQRRRRPPVSRARYRPSAARQKGAGRRATAKAPDARRRLQVITFSVVGAAILVGVIVLAVAKQSSTAGYDTSTRAFVLPSLAAPGKVHLANFRGRPVVVNFFASWCTQCAAELPVFDNDAQALRGKVDFVEVDAEETGDGRGFAQRFDLAGSVTAVARDVGGSQGSGLYEALGGNGSMPMTAFYGPDGALITTHTGAFDASSLAGALQQYYGIQVAG